MRTLSPAHTLMKFAKYVFNIAGIYGLLVLLPQYFLEGKTGRDFPPPITHPEFFYGFIGVAIAWQLAFLLIARDPRRYRLMMVPAMVEKFSFGISTSFLFAAGRTNANIFAASMLDVILGILFVLAFWMTRDCGADESSPRSSTAQ